MNSLISIIVPTYNRSSYLRETLESVLHQSYHNWECIVVDDGSDDNTHEVVKSFKDDRIKYFYKKHEERSIARNFGLSEAKGVYIQFLDSDDILSKDKIEKSVLRFNNLNSNTKKVCISNFRCFYNSQNNTIDAYSKLDLKNFNFNEILYNWDVDFTIPIHCGLFDSRLLKYFQFPSTIIQKEDWFLWLHVFKQENLEVCFIDEPLVLCRLSDRSQNTINKYYENELIVLQKLNRELSDFDRAQYFLHLIRDKNKRILQLHKSIENYKKTRTFRFSKLIKSLFNK
ncbi:glycosyltransferase family 2 protein [Christiangramia sp. ASW11-125]|uniref:glycosyltransferase family 2 protein n=1 Tax=Christiangramia sp. ASW11-125 TaxID=3400701 RepID=UPI003AAA98E2